MDDDPSGDRAVVARDIEASQRRIAEIDTQIAQLSAPVNGPLGSAVMGFGRPAALPPDVRPDATAGDLERLALSLIGHAGLAEVRDGNPEKGAALREQAAAVRRWAQNTERMTQEKAARNEQQGRHEEIRGLRLRLTEENARLATLERKQARLAALAPSIAALYAYADPVLVAALRTAQAKVPSDAAHRPEWNWLRLADAAVSPAGFDQAQAIRGEIQRAEGAAIKDLVGRLKSGELVSRGEFYDHGKPVLPAEWTDKGGNIKPELWNAWHRGWGERIWLGDYSAKFEVRRVRVHKAAGHVGEQVDLASGAPVELTGGHIDNEPKVRGNKLKVWNAAKARGRPAFDDHGGLADYARKIANETGVQFKTVRSYVTKQKELRWYIERLPEMSPVPQ